MKNNAIWFTAGFVVGLGSLLGAIRLLPGTGPVEANATQTPMQSRIEAEQLRLLKDIHAWFKEIREERVAPSPSARESALHSDLQTVRSQLELYKIQHMDRSPHLDENGKLDTANFVARVVSMTDRNGKTTNLGRSDTYGPYLAKFPTNPFVSKGGDRVSFGTQDPAPGDGKTGWYFNTRTGKFSANDSEHTGL